MAQLRWAVGPDLVCFDADLGGIVDHALHCHQGPHGVGGSVVAFLTSPADACALRSEAQLPTRAEGDTPGKAQGRANAVTRPEGEFLKPLFKHLAPSQRMIAGAAGPKWA